MSRSTLLIACALVSACADFDPSHYVFPCDQGLCAAPPPNECVDANTLRLWVSPGVCTAGACDYGRVELDCQNGCAGGQCIGEVCSISCEPGTHCQSGACVSNASVGGTGGGAVAE